MWGCEKNTNVLHTNGGGKDPKDEDFKVAGEMASSGLLKEFFTTSLHFNIWGIPV